jgi:hypothetical protein
MVADGDPHPDDGAVLEPGPAGGAGARGGHRVQGAVVLVVPDQGDHAAVEAVTLAARVEEVPEPLAEAHVTEARGVQQVRGRFELRRRRERHQVELADQRHPAARDHHDGDGGEHDRGAGPPPGRHAARPGEAGSSLRAPVPPIDTVKI